MFGWPRMCLCARRAQLGRARATPVLCVASDQRVLVGAPNCGAPDASIRMITTTTRGTRTRCVCARRDRRDKFLRRRPPFSRRRFADTALTPAATKRRARAETRQPNVRETTLLVRTGVRAKRGTDFRLHTHTLGVCVQWPAHYLARTVPHTRRTARTLPPN